MIVVRKKVQMLRAAPSLPTSDELTTTKTATPTPTPTPTPTMTMTAISCATITSKIPQKKPVAHEVARLFFDQLLSLSLFDSPLIIGEESCRAAALLKLVLLSLSPIPSYSTIEFESFFGAVCATKMGLFFAWITWVSGLVGP